MRRGKKRARRESKIEEDMEVWGTSEQEKGSCK